MSTGLGCLGSKIIDSVNNVCRYYQFARVRYAGLDQIYRIVAFIALGVVVLVMSSLFLKYRHRFEINPEDTAKKESES